MYILKRIVLFILENYPCYPIENNPSNKDNEENFDFENQHREENSDIDQFSQPVVSLTPKSCKAKKMKKHFINLDMNTQTLTNVSIDQVEINENKIGFTEKLTDTEKIVRNENYFEEVNRDFPDCTLLARLHEESCNTNLDPNFTKSSSSNNSNYLNNSDDLFSKTSSNDTNMNFIRDLHQESFQTNLDPYTIVQSQSDSLRENKCHDKLHESKTLINNLEESEFTMTGEMFYDDSFQESDPVVNITPRNPNYGNKFIDSTSDKGTLPNRTSNKSWTQSANMKTEENPDSLDRNIFFDSHSYEISQPVCSNFNNNKRDNVNNNTNNNSNSNNKEKTNHMPSKKLYLDDSFWES